MSVHGARSSRNGRARARGAAFYDLDGTLVDLNLVHAIVYMLSSLGEWIGRASYLGGFFARLPALYLAEQRDRRILNTAIFEVLKGISRDRLQVIGEEYCERALSLRLFPQALELIEANRAAGLEPVLVTGSPDFVVAPLARQLGISDFAANRLVINHGRATGRLVEPVMAGTEKALWCTHYAAGRGMDLADCWGYADSFYDLPFLAAVGHPVAVNPDRRLRATAISRQWPIIDFAKARRFGGRGRLGLQR